jgi:shikimate kinase
MPPAPPPRNVALIGYRGTGKTTVGRLLADRLGFDFADADAELERRLGRTIAELFASGREPLFRDEEERTVAELTARTGLVLATGGGAVLREASRAALRRFGPVVWLRAEPEVLAERLRADRAARPALTSAGTLAEIAAVLAEREPIYRAVADVAIETGGRPVETVVEAILTALAGRTPR